MASLERAGMVCVREVGTNDPSYVRRTAWIPVERLWFARVETELLNGWVVGAGVAGGDFVSHARPGPLRNLTSEVLVGEQWHPFSEGKLLLAVTVARQGSAAAPPSEVDRDGGA